MFDQGIVKIGGKKLNVGICDNDVTRSRGLMGVKSMPQNCGMLFVMDNPEPANFWMKNTLIPLDVVFFDENMKVINVSSMDPHVGKSSCREPVKYVLEINRGWCERNGISKGNIMKVENNLHELKQLVSEVVTDMWMRPTCFGDIIYRPFSDMFYQTIREMKERAHSLNESTSFDDFHREVLSTDIGEFGIYEGVKVPLDIPIPEMFHNEMFPEMNEAKKKLPPGAKLNVPRRGGDTKFHVYVRDPKSGNIKKVGFGAKGMSVGIHDPKRVKSFVARHKCHTRNDKTSASYWSCRLPRYWKSLGLKKTSSKWW